MKVLAVPGPRMLPSTELLSGFTYVRDEAMAPKSAGHDWRKENLSMHPCRG